jgi:cysteine-rich repeat protein
MCLHLTLEMAHDWPQTSKTIAGRGVVMSKCMRELSCLVIACMAVTSLSACGKKRDYSGADASIETSTSQDDAAGASTDSGVADVGATATSTGSFEVTVSLDQDGGAALSDAALSADGASTYGDASNEREAQAPVGPECSKHSECDDGNECNGVETCDEGECTSREVEEDGTVCSGTTEGDFVCRDGNCLKSRCGDRIIDARLEETCDDGNVTNGDGCDVDCNYSCTSDQVCNDSNVCNGLETCDVTEHVCLPGTQADDATECGTDRACVDGRCLSTTCGDGAVTEGEECDDSNLVEGDGCSADCQYDCEKDADCDDQDVCTGNETCNLETHECEAGDVLECEDAVPCTEDKCDPIGGCRFSMIDEDDDGQAPIFEGSDCGTDCDDDNEDVFAGAGELCDDIDNNCDGDKDEFATVWYPDCDGDGYAPLDSESVQQCKQPSAPSTCPSGSRGTWTIRPPTSTTDSDCWDSDPDIYPRADAVWSRTAIDGREDYAFDYNCSYSNEPQYTNVSVPTDSECSPLVLQPLDPVLVDVALLQTEPVADSVDPDPALAAIRLNCTGKSGWEDSAAPACGQPGTYSYCDGCTRVVDVSYVQPCQ